jgi:4-amino-4-deoxy-L-arabinose transferase-like glycosyltransferase
LVKSQVEGSGRVDFAVEPPIASREAAFSRDSVAVVLICVLLIAYDAVRCRLMSITHDEALTYDWHVTGQVFDILRFATPGLPDNNHLLFTLLCKLSVALFGNSELALRLPSIFAYALFCTATVCILMRHLRGPLLLLFLLFAALNPYLVDMMSVARGYGLGIALAICGTYCLLRDSETDTRRSAFWSASFCVCLGLAVLAHLTLVLLYSIGLGIMVFVRLDAWRSRTLTLRRAVSELIAPALIALATAPLLIQQVRILGQQGLLSSSIRKGASFQSETVHDLIGGTLYVGDHGALAYTVLVILAYLLPFLALLFGMVGWMRPSVSAEGRRADRDLLVLAILLVGSALISVLQHHLFGIGYLSMRRTVFLWPLFVLLTSSLFSAMCDFAAVWRWTVSPILLITALVLVVHFALSAKLGMTKDWSYDSQTKTMMADLEQLFSRTAERHYRFGVSWQFEPSINYYLRRNAWTSIGPVEMTRRGDLTAFAGTYDVYYIFNTAIPDVRAATGRLTVVHRYHEAQATLALVDR